MKLINFSLRHVMEGHIIKLVNFFDFLQDQQICLAYCTSESYGLDELRKHFVKNSQFYTIGTLPKGFCVFEIFFYQILYLRNFRTLNN